MKLPDFLVADLEELYELDKKREELSTEIFGPHERETVTEDLQKVALLLRAMDSFKQELTNRIERLEQIKNSPRQQ